MWACLGLQNSLGKVANETQPNLAVKRDCAKAQPLTFTLGRLASLMKYRAVCPKCGVRFSRALYFSWLSHVRRHCSSCGCSYKANSLWEHLGSAGLAVGFGVSLSLGWFGFVSWPISILLFLAVAATGYVLFPYITPFVLIQEEHDHERTSA